MADEDRSAQQPALYDRLGGVYAIAAVGSDRVRRYLRCGLLLAVLLARNATANDEAITCIGDCNGDGSVTIDEVVFGIDVALSEIGSCPALECESPAHPGVFVSCLVHAVNNALDGCPPPASRQGACCFGECPGANCGDMTQADCCFLAENSDIALAIEWCPPDLFDPTTHQCGGCTDACVGLPPTPTPTPTPSICPSDFPCPTGSTASQCGVCVTLTPTPTA